MNAVTVPQLIQACYLPPYLEKYSVFRYRWHSLRGYPGYDPRQSVLSLPSGELLTYPPDFQLDPKKETFLEHYDKDAARKFRLKAVMGDATLAGRMTKWHHFTGLSDAREKLLQVIDPETPQPRKQELWETAVELVGEGIAPAIAEGNTAFFVELAKWAKEGFSLLPKDFDESQIAPFADKGGELSAGILEAFLRLGHETKKLPYLGHLQAAVRHHSKWDRSNFDLQLKNLGLTGLT